MYQRYFSPDQGLLRKNVADYSPTCVFIPSCSEYSKEAIKKYGVLRGGMKSARRILRCHPWQRNHYDPLQ